MKLRWRKHRLFVAWQCGSIAEEMGVGIVKDLGRSPMSGLRRVTLEYLDGGRCLVEISVEMADDLSRVEKALAKAGLTAARSPRLARRALEQAAEIQDVLRAAIEANRVVDLLEYDPASLARAAVTPASVEVVDALGKAHDAITALVESTAPASISAHLARALSEANRALAAVPLNELAPPAEKALRLLVTRWVYILTEAATILGPPEEPDPPEAWRDRLAWFEREQLGRYRDGDEPSGME
jgi:hypothetical protein